MSITCKNHLEILILWWKSNVALLERGTPVMHHSLLAHAFRLLRSDKKVKEKAKQKKKKKGERKSKRQETLTDAMFSQGSSAVSLMEQAVIFLRLGSLCSCSDTQKVYNTQ